MMAVASTMWPDETLEEYVALVRAFPLAHIADDTHLGAAIAQIHRLLDMGEDNLSPAENLYLDALSDLVEVYEQEHVPIPAVSGVEMLRFLMEQHDLTQTDLAPLFGSQGIVSEVLNGKRRLALSHIKKLAARFKVSPAVFVEE